MEAIQMLVDGCNELGIKLTKRQIEQFITYYDLLIEWNNKINLTAITEKKDVILKHFIDSISVYKECSELDKNISLIDVGTGAGFPGLPLKIAFPNIKVTLLDSLNKRIKFLNEVVDKLGLQDVECIHGRAEECAKNKDYRENFDLCVSRAVAKLPILIEYCMPFVKQGGQFISLKGPSISEEINCSNRAIDVLGGKLKDIKFIQIPFTDLSHNLVIIEKIKCSPLKYPRNAGKIKKSPLVNK